MLHVAYLMKIILGLGNPGKQYESNRHNVGHMFIDYLVNGLTGSRVHELEKQKSNPQNSLNSLITNKKLILLKTSVFMNLSGQEVKKYVTRYMLHVTHDLIIAHDDLDIPLGKFKIQLGEGPKLHNGITSIEKSLGTKDFVRIRIGIDNRPAPRNANSEAWVNGERYVLSDFFPEEKKMLEETFPKILARFQRQPPRLPTG